MKVALITPANLWRCPFVKIYAAALDELGVSYDIISLSRDGKHEEGCIDFIPSKSGKIGKIVSYINFVSFVKNSVKKNQYERIVVFTSQLAILLLPFLMSRFKRKYIVDYRDLSIEQKTILMNLFKRALSNSFANFVSSPGFIKCLPSGIDYKISHNFVVANVRGELHKPSTLPDKEPQDISVLTIGGIRDYSSNIEVVKALANKEHVKVLFVGKGETSGRIEQYCKENGIQNVEFYGYYPKEEEPEYIKKATFLNIFYPRIITHDTAISNRFYNSLIYKRPMIVTANTTQGDFARNYNLGLSLDNCDNLEEKLRSWLKDNANEQYAERCNKLLGTFLSDYDRFISVLTDFTKP